MASKLRRSRRIRAKRKQFPIYVGPILIETNDRLQRMLSSHAPNGLIERATIDLAARVQHIFDTLVTPEQLRFASRVLWSGRAVLAPDGDLRLDQIGLKDAQDFGMIIDRSPQVERILAGHLHITMAQRFHGTIAMTCAATGHNMLPDMQQPERLAVRMGSPVCLLHVWQSTSGLITHTSVIGDQSPLIEIHDGEKWRS